VNEPAPGALVVIVEDDAAIAEGLALNLKLQGYRTEVMGDGETARKRIEAGSPDLVLLDITLPKQSGLWVLERLREAEDHVPVIVLSARQDEYDKVAALQLGADDYVTKPFALAELLARIRNLLRHSSPTQSEPVHLRVADLQLDLIRRDARRGDELLQLTAQEFALLEYLVRNAGRVVTRTMILDRVWRMQIDPATNVVDVQIYRLRTKVDGDGKRPLIHTIRGVGYVLKES
jgi:two-component system copper resistance phosphate regulon response regulator CusR